MSLTAVPPTYTPSVRGDALLLTHGREGTELLTGAALVLDAILGGQLAVRPGFRPLLVAGPEDPDTPDLLDDLRTRVLTERSNTPRGWIERAALFAPARIAAELITAGVAVPLAQRFQRRFSLSVDAAAEAAARARLLGGREPHAIALAAALHLRGGAIAPPLPPALHTLSPDARAVIAALA